jgi:hypothetical protein
MQSIHFKGNINDLGNGNYVCKFTPNCIGKYRLDVSIFKRPINQMPIHINVTEFIDSLWTFGGGSSNNTKTSTLKTNSSVSIGLSLGTAGGFSNNKGSTDRDFNMPISVRCIKNFIYVLDSGNSRIKVLNSNGQFVRHIFHNGLNESSCTGLVTNSLLPSQPSNKANLFTINWRLKLLSQLEMNDNENLFQDSHELIEQFEEPIGLAETYHPNLFILQDRKKLNLCSKTGLVLSEALENKMKLECGIKNITSYCGNLLKRRLFVADALSIYEFDLDWLTDYKLDYLIEKHSLNDQDENNK